MTRGIGMTLPARVIAIAVGLALPLAVSLRSATAAGPVSLRSGIVREEVRSRDLVGVFYHARDARKLPVLVALSGSEGGLDVADWAGPRLASRGYAVLGVAYFSPPGSAIDGVPTTLAHVPVELIERARAWLGGRAEADVGRFGLLGYSRGAEFALLLASTYEWIDAAIAYAPSDVVWQGIQYGGGSSVGSSWSRAGRDLPFLPTTGTRDSIAVARQTGRRVRLAAVARANLAAASAEAREAAAIPIERSHAALLLVGGGDDQLWDSGASVERAAARLNRARYPYAKEILVYPDAGHGLLGTGDRPIPADSTSLFDEGGTPEADARAQADSWPKVLDFLDRELRHAPSSRPASRARH
jgi:dienelactone hydrolase